MPTSACPDPETLAAYRVGGLPAADREKLEDHGVSCAACQEILVYLGHAEAPPSSVVRLPWRWVAAAVLLLAAGGWLASRQGRQPESLRTADKQPPPPALPAGLLGDPGAPRGYLASGVDLLLEPGASLRTEEGRRHLQAAAGTFWLEAWDEPVTVALPQATLILTRGVLRVSIPRPASQAWLLGSAWAEEGVPQVEILEGAAELKAGTIRILLQAGTRCALEGAPERWAPSPLPEREILALAFRRADLAAALAGEALLEPGLVLGKGRSSAGSSHVVPPAYRWVTVLSGREASTEVGMTLGLSPSGAWYQWPVGLTVKPPLPREVIEVLWDGRTLRGRVGGRTVFALARDQVGDALNPVPGGAWGISVWGGSAVVERSVLQEALR